MVQIHPHRWVSRRDLQMLRDETESSDSSMTILDQGRVRISIDEGS